jgi:hypothetical protein
VTNSTTAVCGVGSNNSSKSSSLHNNFVEWDLLDDLMKATKKKKTIGQRRRNLLKKGRKL